MPVANLTESDLK